MNSKDKRRQEYFVELTDSDLMVDQETFANYCGKIEGCNVMAKHVSNWRTGRELIPDAVVDRVRSLTSFDIDKGKYMRAKKARPDWMTYGFLENEFSHVGSVQNFLREVVYHVCRHPEAALQLRGRDKVERGRAVYRMMWVVFFAVIQAVEDFETFDAEDLADGLTSNGFKYHREQERTCVASDAELEATETAWADAWRKGVER